MPQTEDFTDEHWNETLVPSLFTEYQKIHQLLAKKELDTLLPLFAERNREMDIAYYHEAGYYEKTLRESFEEKFENGKILDPIDEDQGQAHVSTMGTLLRRHNLIVFKNKEETLFNHYDIWFRKEGDQWIISR